MTTLHALPVTPDPSPEDTYWRERCEKEFGLRPDPTKRNRYYLGYWKECFEYWQKKEHESCEQESRS